MLLIVILSFLGPKPYISTPLKWPILKIIAIRVNFGVKWKFLSKQIWR